MAGGCGKGRETGSITPGEDRQMRRFRQISALACLGALCARCAAAELSAKELFAKAAPAVVKVLVYDPVGKRLGCGTGFVVSPGGQVITNYHVIEEAGTTDNLRIELKGTLRKVQGLQGLLVTHDLALLAVQTARGEKLPHLALAAKMPAQGEKAYAVGYPLALPNATITDGLINGFQKLGDFTLLQTSAPISEGSSGGPLLVADGTVVGVTTCSLIEGQNLNFAVPAEHIRTLLRGPGTLRKEIPRLIHPEMLAALPAVQKPVSLLRPVNLRNLTIPMTLERLYTGMVQAYIIAGVSKPGLSQEDRKQRFGAYVELLCQQQIIARHVTCEVQVVQVQEAQDRTRHIRYVQRYVSRNNDPRRAAAHARRLEQAAVQCAGAICKSPCWPQSFAAYFDKEQAGKLAGQAPGQSVRISGYISAWAAFPGKKLGLSVTLDACVVEQTSPARGRSK